MHGSDKSLCRDAFHMKFSLLGFDSATTPPVLPNFVVSNLVSPRRGGGIEIGSTKFPFPREF